MSKDAFIEADLLWREGRLVGIPEVSECEAIVVGGGVVGASVARELALRGIGALLLEKESGFGLHASGRNSGVLHSGVFNKPGTWRSEMTRKSLPRIKEYCRQRGIPFRETGKLVSARTEREIANLERLCRNSTGNGLGELTIRDPSEVPDFEPHGASLPFIHVPQAGIIDSQALVQSFLQDARANGAVLKANSAVLKVSETRLGFRVTTQSGEYQSPVIVNAAGVHADRLAWQLGLAEEFVVVPFRGDYYKLAPSCRTKVHGLIYPTKDPELPFLGIHLTATTDGETLVGPNAVIPPGREAYVGILPTASTIAMALDPGFIRMITRNKSVRKHAPAELLLSLSPRAFFDAASALVRGLRKEDLVRARSGIRAQLVRREDGSLVDDFTVIQAPNQVHILNAVSPTLTNSLAIGEAVADMLGPR